MQAGDADEWDRATLIHLDPKTRVSIREQFDDGLVAPLDPRVAQRESSFLQWLTAPDMPEEG